jgi:hypothetical protein
MNNIPLRISELPIGRTKAYQEINEGRLRAVKCEKLTLILPEDYDRWLKSLPPVVAKSSRCSRTQMEQRKMTIPVHSCIVTPTGMTGHKDGDNGTGERSSARERRRLA